MRTIIAGSRTVTNPQHTLDAIACSGFYITEVVSGCAFGPDTHGALWAKTRRIPVTRFPADWKTYGKRAGMVRNRFMAQYAACDGGLFERGALIAVWDGVSAGTAAMIRFARECGLNVYVHTVAPDTEPVMQETAATASRFA